MSGFFSAGCFIFVWICETGATNGFVAFSMETNYSAQCLPGSQE